MSGRVVVSAEEHAARAALAALAEPGAPTGVRVGRAVLTARPSEVLAAIRAGDGRLDPDGRMARRASEVDGPTLLSHGASIGARFVGPGDDEWPPGVDILVHTVDSGPRAGPPPLGLWVRGRPGLAAALERSVAVVGSRAATEYGIRVAAEIAADLAAAGWTVVSGAAYGIDGAAHRGALAVSGTTVAVLACGVDTAYPRGHAGLLHQIAGDGIVVSELPTGSPPSRLRFLARNRLIAAMTCGTVVVEAALRSGALNTAGWALDLGRELMAVPGPVTSAMSEGCHDLVRKGAATVVTNAADVIDLVGELGRDAAVEPAHETRPWDDLDPVSRDVLEALPARGHFTVDRICYDTGLSASACIGALTELSIAGLVVLDGDGWRLVRRGGA